MSWRDDLDVGPRPLPASMSPATSLGRTRCPRCSSTTPAFYGPACREVGLRMADPWHRRNLEAAFCEATAIAPATPPGSLERWRERLR